MADIISASYSHQHTFLSHDNVGKTQGKAHFNHHLERFRNINLYIHTLD